MFFEIFKIQGEKNHSPVLWGITTAYKEAVKVAQEATDDRGKGPEWGDPNQGVTAQIIWVKKEGGQKMKVARVKEVDTSKIDLPDEFVGDFVVVPEDFPDEVFLFVWSHRYDARPQRRSERVVEVRPPAPTPEEAWKMFLE